MKLTNIHNLPATIYNIMNRNIYKPSYSKLRVTELIGAPLVKQLTIEHWDELSEDVSDGLWRILGTACHKVLEEGNPDDSIGEERLSATIGDTVITGQSDLYFKSGIQDWKVTSVFSFLLGVKEDWIAQLNIYRFLWEENGFPVKYLKINAILRDWQRSKALYNPADYPQIPFVSYDVPMWDKETLTKYILGRIELHKQTPAPECSSYEKWERPTTFAVMKGTNKRASRVLDTEKEAKAYIENVKDEKVKDQLIIELRKGECVKCADYCTPRKFCPYNIYNKEGEKE